MSSTWYDPFWMMHVMYNLPHLKLKLFLPVSCDESII